MKHSNKAIQASLIKGLKEIKKGRMGQHLRASNDPKTVPPLALNGEGEDRVTKT